MKRQFTKRWGYMIAPTQYPSVFYNQKGGFLVRGRVKDPTGKVQEIIRTLHLDSEVEALAWLDQEKAAVRNGCLKPAKMLFSEFAASVMERKVFRGEILGSQDKWKQVLEHLIQGIQKDGYCPVIGLGDYPVAELKAVHLEAWKDQMAVLIGAGIYAPTTINTWLSILRVISKSASREYEIRDFMTGVDNFSTVEHVTYTEESPNALLPKDVGPFLSILRRDHPRHFAMATLGFATGLRPSSLRPLRRKGPETDIDWETGRLLVRRSEVRGKIRNATKQGTRYAIPLPQAVVDILKWHIQTQLNEAQEASDLLFPSIEGGYRDVKVLKKPFAQVGTSMGLTYPLTQRGMRRTYQDLCRVAGVHHLVQKSISGHSSDEMVELYSSISEDERRDSVQRVFLQLIPGGRSEPSGEIGGVKEVQSGGK